MFDCPDLRTFCTINDDIRGVRTQGEELCFLVCCHCRCSAMAFEGFMPDVDGWAVAKRLARTRFERRPKKRVCIHIRVGSFQKDASVLPTCRLHHEKATTAVAREGYMPPPAGASTRRHPSSFRLSKSAVVRRPCLNLGLPRSKIPPHPQNPQIRSVARTAQLKTTHN